MKQNLYVRASFLSFLLTIVALFHANSQASLKSYKDSSSGKFGFKNKLGQIAVPAKYQDVGSFSNKLAPVKYLDKWGFIDSAGKEVIAIKYQAASDFADSMARVKFNDKWGFIDPSGKEIIPVKYQDASGYNVAGLVRVKLSDKWGMVDKKGKVIIPIKYQSIYDFNDGLAAAMLNDKWGFIDKNDKQVIPARYQSVFISFTEGLGGAKWNDKWGFIDKTGKEVIPAKYDEINAFKDGWAKVSVNDKWGAVDKTGKEIVPPKYDGVFSYNFNSGLGKVELNNKWGAVDKDGKEVIAIKYEDMYPVFNEGLSAVKLNGKWGYVDKTGKEAIPFKYSNAWNFAEGFAQVELNGLKGYIDKTGKEIIPVKYQTIHGFSDDLAAVQLNKLWGYVDKTGREVIAPQYEYAYNFSNGKAEVKKDGKILVITKPTGQTAAAVSTTGGLAVAAKTSEPPVPMNGIVDQSLVGAWLWNPKEGGVSTIYKFSGDGTYEFYVGNSMDPSLRWFKDVTLYWRLNGNILETYCKDWKEVAKTTLEKKNDAATNKPAILMQTKSETRVFLSMDNKALFAGVPKESLNSVKDGHDETILGLWKYQYPNSANSAYIRLLADGSYESYNNSVSTANRTDKGKCKWKVDDGMFVLTCEGSAPTRNSIKKVNDPATGKPTLLIADYYPYFSMDNKAPWTK